MRKINYKEKGITLVALVITIIILLILAGVTLNTALSDNGLFQKAKYAGEKYKESERQEDETIQQIVDDIDLSQYTINGLMVQYDAIINNGSKKSEDASILKNLTGNSKYDGKIIGATLNQNYISFDGTDDYIEIGNVDSSTITIEMTVKLYDGVNIKNGRLFSNAESGGIVLYMNTNKFQCEVGGDDNNYITCLADIIIDKIINIVVVFDGKQIDLYINNDLIQSNNLGDKNYKAPVNDNIMILGAERNIGVNTEWFSKMDLYSCRIYNRALSKEELTNNYKLDKDRYMK